jgi:hypothetical protein
MNELEDALRIVTAEKRKLQDQKTQMGIGGIPGIEERWNLMLEDVYGKLPTKLTFEKENLVLTGYLGGFSLALAALQDVIDLGEVQGTQLLHSFGYELSLLLNEQELIVTKEALRKLTDED